MATATVNGLSLWYDELGDPADPVLLLLTGSNAQATLWWPPELTAQFAALGFRVVRMDWRDMGLSEWIDPKTGQYSLKDLSADVLGLLDHLKVEAVHLLGFSMGAMVAQLVAIQASHRVRSLTLLSTTTASPTLPPPSEAYRATMAALAAPVASLEEAEELALSLFDAMVGSRRPFEEVAWRPRLRAELTRGHNPACRHHVAMAAAEDRTALLANIACPTLVVHGQDDEVLLPEHGRATAAAIPGAALVEFEGVGHEVPQDVESFFEVVQGHLARTREGA